ncbi:MAG: serine/threonine-protein kinase [Dokdonella sp.]
MSARLGKPEFHALDALLQEALDLDGESRTRWLQHIATEQPDRAARLRGMLIAADQERSDSLDRVLDETLWAALAGDSASGQRFGSWRAIATLAHGGMAQVLLAERADGAFVARAAIKCLWPGLAIPGLVARFEQERQILARLDDPRIARLLDGGVREDGVPWLALEYVDGTSLDLHCDALCLDVDARVTLWLDVAAAVATAHRHLIVHRDLKPSNILVSRNGAVKLLDFGIAKLLDPGDFPHASPPTQQEGRALTRYYASPEQLRGESVTTASDVYQLGLLLYELVTGVQPFRCGSAVMQERNILDNEPALASQTASAGNDADQRATARGTTTGRLVRKLRGDLDAILATTLAKPALARYASVDALCEDIARWRCADPVRARRSGPLRRAGKWLQRNALAASTAALVISITTAYAVSTRLQSIAIAEEAERNRVVGEYLGSWMRQADPGGTEGRDLTASEMLESGLERARRDLRDQPALQAEIFSVVSEIRISRGEYALAEPVLREADAIYRRLDEVKPDLRGRSTQGLALLLHMTGRYADAEQMSWDAVEQRTAALGGRANATLYARQQLADVLHTRGRYARSIETLETALEDARSGLGVAHSLTANIARNLADLYRDAGRTDEAIPLYAHALETFRDIHGDLHVNTIVCEIGLGRLKLEAGAIDEAAEILASAVSRYVRIKRVHVSALTYYDRHLAQIDEMRGNFDAAEHRLAQLADSIAHELRPEHLLFGYFAIDRAFIALARGDNDAASAFLDTAARTFDWVQPEGHPRHSEILLGRALIARAARDAIASTRLLEEATVLASRELDRAHPLFEALALAGSNGCADDDRSAPSMVVLRVCRALAASNR